MNKDTIYLSGLLSMTRAAITPGTHPHNHNKNTIKIDPHPRPMTESGGKMMARITLQKLMIV